MEWLLLIHIGATLFMVGLIWFVQIVHYPLFDHVDSNRFPTYEVANMRLTSYVVLPPMLLEAATALLFVVYPPLEISPWLFWLGAIMVGIIWLSTFLFQVPQHNKLSRCFEEGAHRFLVRSNWIRTWAWTARGVLVLLMVKHLLVA